MNLPNKLSLLRVFLVPVFMVFYLCNFGLGIWQYIIAAVIYMAAGFTDFLDGNIARKYGLERFIRFGLLIGAAMYIALFGLHMITDVNPYVHMIVSNCAMGLASVSIYMQWGLVSEAIDYNEMITGKRTEGSIYGTFNLSRRVGQTIGNSATVLMLGWTGYNADLAVQSATTVSGIKIIAVLLPGIFVLGSWAAFKFLWNMDSETRNKIDKFKKAQKEQ